MNKPIKSNKFSFKLNEDIRGYESVRLVGEGTESKVISLSEANEIANKSGLDLVLINEKSSPPIVRIVKYDKFIYDLKRNGKQNKKPTSQLKEVQLTVNIAQHDIDTKSKQAAQFLEKGNKVKVVLTMKGRQLGRREESKKSLFLFLTSLEDVAKIESLKDEGNKTIAILTKKG